MKTKLKLTPYTPEETNCKICLDANESHIALSEKVLVSFNKKLKDINFNRYPDWSAKELCSLYAEYLGVSREFVVAGNGSDELLGLICQVFLSDEDKVLTIVPDFSMYKFYAELRQGMVIEYINEPPFVLDVDDFIEAIGKVKPKIVFLSTPCNPTGRVLKKEDVLKIVKSTTAIVVIDEAYMDFSCESVVDKVQDFDNLIVARTLSKAGGIASARVGFVVSNPININLIAAAKSPYNVNTISQMLAISVLESKEELKENISALKVGANNLFSSLLSIKFVFGSPFNPIETESNFVCCLTDKAKEIKELLKANGILIRAFNGFVRISVGKDGDIKKLINILKENA